MSYYAQDFESTTVGTLPAGWINGASATFAVNTTTPITGAQSFGEAVPLDGQLAYYSSRTSEADSCAQFDQRIQGTVSGTAKCTGPMLRYDPSGNNGYLFNPDFSVHNISLFKLISGTFTQVGSPVTIPTYSDHTNVTIKVEASGTTIRFKVWQTGASEPGSWTGSWTDSSVSAAGKFAFRTTKAGSPAETTTVIDNLFIDVVGSEFPEASPATAFAMTGPTAGPAGAASSVFTVTPVGGTSSSTITPPAGSTPSTLVWSGDASAKTFTVNESVGTYSIAITSSGAETMPSPISYTAKATESIVFAIDGGITGVTCTLGVYNLDGTAFTAPASASETPSGSGSFSGSVVGPTDFQAVRQFKQTGGLASTEPFQVAPVNYPVIGCAFIRGIN